MILDHLIVQDVGAYAGRQEADLSPRPGQPIVLFGGMNGGGKTTLLDAVQLVLYGNKARLSNRGRLPYLDYLRESIHRGTHPSEGAGITLRFRRFTDGEERHYEVRRHWREGVKGMEEHFQVLRDGLPDEVLSANWDDAIAAFLPVRLAHLFFFDGEQIASLAEGSQTAEIVGSAVEGLLGLDLLERLSTDLKVFERGVREERAAGSAEDQISRALRQAEGELAAIEQRLESVALDAGQMRNRCNALAQAVLAAEEAFTAAGGDLLLRRGDLEREAADLAQDKARKESELRDLLAGPLPMALVDDLLAQVAEQARREIQIRHARVLLDALEERDREVLAALAERGLAKPDSTGEIDRLLAEDRVRRGGLAQEPLVLDADDRLPVRIDHLRHEVIPPARASAKGLTDDLALIDERLQRVKDALQRVPTQAYVAETQAALTKARDARAEAQAELRALETLQDTLLVQRERAQRRLSELARQDVDGRYAEDEGRRMLHHAARVRNTLGKLREKAVQRHIGRIEALVLDSFRSLLHKPDLAQGLSIDPRTYTVTLTGRDGRPLPFNRLSAGERQLLATAILWGLARASGRPVPTIVDTPLGRLDSSHRRNLVERYFPHAAHQVILLSTDEEIVGPYLEALDVHVARSYLLNHPHGQGLTKIDPGYFPRYEAAS